MTPETTQSMLAGVLQRLARWARYAHDNGWIDAERLASLTASAQARPADLFDSAERPLVIGLFGGTGVGKSSLLNRLAGDDIARTGVERPTSREITVYVHESVTVSRLPEEFPLSRLRTAIHRNANYRSVMWVDMPDVDSVEAQHRALVQAWLPYLDVVLYTVNPERYRDDIGWRMLLEEGERHAWLFALTHWDRADPAQHEDFRTLIAAAGLPEAPLYRLDNTGQVSDDFAELEQRVQALAGQQTLLALEQAGIGQRLRELHVKAAQARDALPADTDADLLIQAWHEHWKPDAQALGTRLDNRAAALAQTSTDAPASKGRGRTLWSALLPGPARALVPPTGTQLIDAGIEARLNESAEGFVQAMAEQHWPIGALRQHLSDDSRVAPDGVSTVCRARRLEAIDSAVEASFARPGSAWQRVAVRVSGTLCVVLPVAALGWTGWHVVTGYWYSGQRSGPASGHWLGTDFAVHSLLLLGLAWALPTLLRKLVRPGPVQMAREALQRGAQALLATHDAGIQGACIAASREHQALMSELDAVFEIKPGAALTPGQDGDNRSPPDLLHQLLMRRPNANQSRRPAAVRATTHKSTEQAP